MQLCHGRLLPIFPILTFAILVTITAMPVTLTQPTDIASIQGRDSSPYARLGFFGIFLSKKLQSLLRSLCVELPENASQKSKNIRKSVDNLTVQYSAILTSVNELRQQTSTITKDDSMWADIPALSNPPRIEIHFLAVAKNLCFGPGGQKTVDELHNKLDHFVRLPELQSYAHSEKKDVLEYSLHTLDGWIALLLIELEKLCSNVKEGYAPSPKLALVNLISDIFHSANLPILLKTLSGIPLTGVDTHVATAIKELEEHYQNIIAKLEQSYATTSTHPKIEMWGPLPVAGTPDLKFMRKKLCFTHPGWHWHQPVDSNGAPLHNGASDSPEDILVAVEEILRSTRKRTLLHVLGYGKNEDIDGMFEQSSFFLDSLAVFCQRPRPPIVIPRRPRSPPGRPPSDRPPQCASFNRLGFS